MRGMVPNDPQAHVSDYQFAVIYAPRLKRSRFPAACVDIKDTREAAVAEADTHRKRYPAKVHGPSKSSEGQYIYYLIEWLI